MKKQLNLICVLIFFFVGLSMVPNVYTLGAAFVDGFKAGLSQVEEAKEQGTSPTRSDMLSPLTLCVWPKSLAETPDKLLNQKDHKWYPASHVKAIIWAKTDDAGMARHISLLAFVSLFFIIKAVIQFYKLINAINHEVIFDWMNVRRLNGIGRDLLISFVVSQACLLMTYWQASCLFELRGYDYNFWSDFQSMSLIMGLVALLVGRIFAIGLQMKEEQELTI